MIPTDAVRDKYDSDSAGWLSVTFLVRTPNAFAEGTLTRKAIFSDPAVRTGRLRLF